MDIVYILLPIALCLGGGFAIAFIYSALRGQYDDLETPARRMLLEEIDEFSTGKENKSESSS